MGLESMWAGFAPKNRVEQVFRLGHIWSMGVERLDGAGVGLLGGADEREAGEIVVAPVGGAVAVLGRKIDRRRMGKVLSVVIVEINTLVSQSHTLMPFYLESGF